MAAHQTFECANFRDVGEALDGLGQSERSPWLFPKNVLTRGGEIDLVHPDKIKNPKTVLNLRNMADDLTVPLFTAGGCQHIQSAMAREVEKYHTQQTEVRKWLDSILIMVQNFDPSQRLPLMIHCRFGRDRTGIIVAAILAAVGIPRDLITEEFMLSSDAKLEDIQACLDPFFKTQPSKFFRGVDFAKLRKVLGVTQNPNFSK